jgi:CRP/FNR family transcriptional regulator, cyclic AMP receptor protein
MRDTRIELLQQMPVFGGIRAEVLQTLLDLCQVVSIAANEYFFREHDQANSMFVIESGKVAVLKNWRRHEHLLKILKEGDCFGEMAVMDLSPRSASVRAVKDCTAIRVSAANLYKLYEQDTKQFALIQMNMGREVTRRLREADNRLFERMGPDANISEFSWAARDARDQPRTERSDH